MTLRRLERLIKEARYSSNTQDTDAVKDGLLVHYSNRVQSMIEDRLFLTNSSNGLFQEDFTVNVVQGQLNYDLPFDIYGKSAIKSVGIQLQGAYGKIKDPIPFISESESGNKWGYALKESQIMLNLQRSVTEPIVVTYVRKIPTVGLRFGTGIAGAGAGTVTVGTTVEDIMDIDDYFSTVDINGVVKSRGNLITSYDKVTGIIGFVPGNGVPANGEYVIPGKYATSHSQLPLEAEKIFLEVLERRIAQRQSATDIGIISQLTDEEVALVDAVFAKGTDDNEVPPINSYSEYC